MIQDPNITAVELAAVALGALLDELVLVGGCAVGLLITDRARPPVRPTLDVDLLTEVAPTANYYAFCERLKALGFREDSSGEVICRWVKGTLLLDVMPTDGAVLGFTNSWYAAVVKTAEWHVLPSGRSIRLANAALFLATKLEAFAGRGGGDYLHHDIEDIITLIDGRDSIVNDVLAADSEVREFIRHEFDDMLADTLFVDRMDWHLQGEKSRKDLVLERMRKIAGL